MKYYPIEIDEYVWNYLQKHAEPLVDTPNSVLRRLLLKTSLKTSPKEHEKLDKGPSFIHSVPKALSQVLEVIYEVKKRGRSRSEATNIVAKRNGTAPQTIIDKYCRQLNKRAFEIDHLLQEPGMNEFKMILKNKFSKQTNVIDTFFDSLFDETEITPAEKEVIHSPIKRKPRVPVKTESTVTYGRKSRDPELEKELKSALGNLLSGTWGDSTLHDQSMLSFNDQNVLCKYSGFRSDQSRWFYGVSKKYWNNWGANDYLGLIMENESGDGYSYILLNSEESKILFGRCSESNDEKKINMRIYMDDGIIRIQEWKEFDVEGRLESLNIER